MRRHSGIGTRLATGLMAMAIAVVPFRAAVRAHHRRRGKQADRRPRLAQGRGRDLQQPGPHRLVGRAAVRRRPVARRMPRRCQGTERRPGRLRQAGRRRRSGSSCTTASGTASGSTPMASPRRRPPRGSTGSSWSGSPRTGNGTAGRSRPTSIPPRRGDSDKGPPAQIDVYTGGNLRLGRRDRPEGARGRRPSDWKATDSRRPTASCSRARSSTWRRAAPSPRGCGWNGSSRGEGSGITTSSWRGPTPTRRGDGS